MKLSDNQLRQVLGQYGHSFGRLDRVQSGYRNSSHIVETGHGLMCNFIVYKREDGMVQRIKRVNELSRHVREAGLPVRVPLDERVMQLQAGAYAHHGCLYSFERGDTISWEAYSKKHIKLLGMAMGRFHLATRQFDGHLPRVTDEYRAIVGRMHKYFDDPHVARALYGKLGLSLQQNFADFMLLFEKIDQLPDQQALHMDLVRGNVLFRPAETGDVLVVGDIALSGILDLEKAGFGPRVLDVARTLAFLYVDCPKPAQHVRRYFVDSGYQKRGLNKLTPGPSLLEQLVTTFLTYDFYKFLRQNPYESLLSNYHFIRTRDILLARKVLQ